jgi:hypothetical protein
MDIELPNKFASVGVCKEAEGKSLNALQALLSEDLSSLERLSLSSIPLGKSLLQLVSRLDLGELRLKNCNINFGVYGGDAFPVPRRPMSGKLKMHISSWLSSLFMIDASMRLQRFVYHCNTPPLPDMPSTFTVLDLSKCGTLKHM